MNDYVEAVCVGKPMGLPEYDMDAEQWAVYFEESETPWSDEPRDVVAVQCENVEEATDIYNYYNQNPVESNPLPEAWAEYNSPRPCQFPQLTELQYNPKIKLINEDNNQ
tara:strand:- start:106 stop:432 length:327 start_codon:yes stop_codon:yes gene_type:complete